MTNVTTFVFLLVSLLCSALPGFAQTHSGNLTGINGPTFVALDTRAGTTWLYVSEHGEVNGTGGGRVLRFNLTSGSATPQVVANSGSGDGLFRSPDAILVEPTTGDIFVADRFLNRIQRLSINQTTGAGTYVMKWGQDLAGAADEMQGPLGLARDSTGAIYISEHGDAATGTVGGRIVSKYTISGTTATRVWRITHSLSTPYGIVVNGSSLMVADGYNARVQTWDLNGAFQSLFTFPAGVIPLGLSIDSSGALWVAQTSGDGSGSHQRVEKLTTAGASTGVSFGSLGGANGQFLLPFHAVLNSATNRLYVADYGNDRVQIFDMTPAAGDTTPPTVASFVAGAASGNSVDFTLTFSEAVTGVDTSDFTVNASGGAAGTVGVASGSGTTWTIPVTFSGTGSFTLTVAGGATANIRDAATNLFAGGTGSTSTSFSIPAAGDTTRPTIASFDLDIPSATLTHAKMIVTFSEPVTGVDATDFAVNVTGSAAATITGVTQGASAAVWNVDFDYTGTSGSMQMAIRTSGTNIADVAANAFIGGGVTATPAYSVNSAPPGDMTLPTVSSFTAGTASGGSVAFTATFSETVTGVSAGDFAAVTTGTAAAGTISVTPVSGTIYTVTVPFTGSGTISLLAVGGATSNIRDGTTHWFAGGSTSAVATVGGSSGSAPTIAATQTATAGTVGSAYSYQVVATGATSFSTTSTLPAGLALSAAGVVSGTPTAATPAGGTTIAVTATNANGSNSGNVVINVAAAGSAPTIAATQNATAGTVGTAYSYQVVATGATSFSTTSTLPAGLSLSASGLISGTPTAATPAGGTTLAVRATNANGFNTGNVVITIAAAGVAPTIAATQNATAGTVGTAYSYQVVATGATSFSTTGTLPAGLSLSASGLISGTPTAATPAGGTTVAVRATNANGFNTGNVVIVIAAAPAVAPTIAATQNATSGTVGSAYSYQVVATGATSFSTTSTLPAGLSLSAAGVVSGTPTTAGSTTIAVRATNASGFNTGNVVINIATAPVVIPPVIIPPTTQSQTITFVSPVSDIFVNQPILLGATASSSLPVSYAVVSGNATISGSTLTIHNVQPVTVRASQSGNATFSAAAPVNLTLTAVKSAQSINFPSMSNALTSDQTIALGASASSGLSVTYTLVSGPASLSGSVLTLNGEPGTVVVRATQGGDDAFNPAVEVTRSFAVNPAVRVSNLSSRLRVTPGDGSRAVIAGFVIDGTATTSIMVRAVGPGLAQFGISDGLAAPRLQLFNNVGVVVAENNGWNGASDVATTSTRVGAFALAAGSADSAVVAQLPPGAYTALVTGAGSGTVLIEVYDAASGAQLSTQQLVNISTRGFVDTGDGALIAGFVVAGSSSKRVLVRGVGPGLSQFGVPSVLADPVVKIYRNGTAAAIAENDNWEAATGVSAATSAAGAFPLDAGSKDAAIVLTLPPGQYSAVITGTAGTTGAGLVEVYELP